MHGIHFFFYKQPPYKQLALEASKWQATFRAILFELSNFLKYENCLLHIIDILIKRKMNEQHLYYAKQHRNRNCVLFYVKAYHQIPRFTWCDDSIQRSITSGYTSLLYLTKLYTIWGLSWHWKTIASRLIDFACMYISCILA